MALLLETHQIVVSLIGATSTEQGLEVHCCLDETLYQKGRKITDAQMEQINLKRNSFHGEWNYEIEPN